MPRKSKRGMVKERIDQALRASRYGDCETASEHMASAARAMQWLKGDSYNRHSRLWFRADGLILKRCLIPQ